MADVASQQTAIYQALKAVDEVAAALQSHLIEEHHAHPERGAERDSSANSMLLLRQARERLGEGLRTIAADPVDDGISLRNAES